MTPAIAVAISAAIVITGWWVVHHLSAKRDRKAKLRDLRTEYLLATYRRLENASNRPVSSPEDARAIESAVADVFLMGNAEQIEAAKKFCEGVQNDGGASVLPLIKLLRNDLRMELGLEFNSPDYLQVRFGWDPPNAIDPPNESDGSELDTDV